MFSFFVLQFSVAVPPKFSGIPAFAIKVALNPINSSFFKIIFKIPAVPEASYRAEGEVTTSTFSIDSAGSCRKAAGPESPTKPEGFPFIRILTLSFPLSEIFPSTSTDTAGMLSITSVTLPPRTVMSLPTLYTLLSSLISTSVRSPISSTSSSDSELIVSAKFPKLVVSLISLFSRVIFSNPIYSMVTLYFPGKISISKFPFASVMPP